MFLKQTDSFHMFNEVQTPIHNSSSKSILNTSALQQKTHSFTTKAIERQSHIHQESWRADPSLDNSNSKSHLLIQELERTRDFLEGESIETKPLKRDRSRRACKTKRYTSNGR